MSGEIDLDSKMRDWQRSSAVDLTDLKSRTRLSSLRLKVNTFAELLITLSAITVGLWLIFSNKSGLWPVIGVYIICISTFLMLATIRIKARVWQERGESADDYLGVLIARAASTGKLLIVSRIAVASMSIYVLLVFFQMNRSGMEIGPGTLLVTGLFLCGALVTGELYAKRQKERLLLLLRMKKDLAG